MALCCALAASALAGASVGKAGGLDLELVVLTEDEAAPYNAKCLDGSPPAIYYSPARGEANKDNWVLYFKGGGWCYDEASCVRRSKTVLGTTKSLPHFVNGTWDITSGPLHPSETLNPAFANYNRVLLWYCDGASFAGGVEQPVVVGDTTLHFRGKAVLEALMAKLRTSYGLSSAKNVLLTGCSAGGYATYAHADAVKGMIESKALQRYKVAGLSGFFLDHLNTAGEPYLQGNYDYMYNMQNMTLGVNAGCVKATGGAGNCSFPQDNYAHIQAPYFVLNSMVDAWQMGNDLQVGCQLKKCNASQVASIAAYQKDFYAAISSYSTFGRKGNGAFLYNCVLHCGEQNSNGFNSITVEPLGGGAKTLMQAALTTWWNSADEPAASHTYVETCSLTGPEGCNPTCPSNTWSCDEDTETCS